MDVNSAITQAQTLAHAHPYLGLALILFLIGSLVRGKASLVLYALGGLALLKSFGLIDTFFSFLKQVPDLIQKIGGL